MSLSVFKTGAMTKRAVSDSHPTQTSVLSPDPSLPLQRLRDMGFSIPIQPEPDWLSASELFPWHSIFILNSPDRYASGGVEHLGLVLARKRYGLCLDLGKNARAAHILCSNLPIGNPDETAEILLEEALAYNGDRREPLRIAALHGLAHLEFRSRFAPTIQRGRFVRALRSLDFKHEDDAIRAALHLVSRLHLIEAIEFVCRVALTDNSELRLSAIDTLLWLGEPGMTAFQQLRARSEGDALKTFKAVESGLERDLDPMHALITSQDWTERNGAIRVLRSLVIKKGVPPEGPMEIILSRFRDDSDNDNRNLIGLCLADLIAVMGPAAVDPVVALITELPGDSKPLIDALTLGGAPGMTVAKVQEMGTNSPQIQRRLRAATRRLLAVVSPDYPSRIEDWIEDQTIQAVQWGYQIPAPVQAWFDDVSRVPGWQIVDTLLRGKRNLQDGALASAAMNASPALATALECLAPRWMNRGADQQWSGIVSLLASSRTPNQIPSAWMRVALGGFASGPALPSDPEHIGGLLSVAASPLERGADHALELLAAMPAEARIIATYVLRSLPVGITSLQGDACNPPETGFGPRDKKFPGLGTIRWQPSPSLLDVSFQQFLLDKPAAWLTPNQVVDQLIQSAKKAEQGYTKNLWTWDDNNTGRLIQGIPPIRVQQAIVSINVADGCPKIAARLVKALGAGAAEGDLGPLVLAATQDAPAEEEDPELEELEEILGLP